MKVSVISYRDEFRAEPLELAAFRDQGKAASVRNFLTTKYQEILGSENSEESVNAAWHTVLGQSGIPEERYFDLDTLRHTNFVFSVKELEFIE